MGKIYFSSVTIQNFSSHLHYLLLTTNGFAHSHKPVDGLLVSNMNINRTIKKIPLPCPVSSPVLNPQRGLEESKLVSEFIVISGKLLGNGPNKTATVIGNQH